MSCESPLRHRARKRIFAACEINLLRFKKGQCVGEIAAITLFRQRHKRLLEVTKKHVHETHQQRRRTVAVMQRLRFSQRIGVIVADVIDQPGRAAAPSINGLLGIADEKKASTRRVALRIRAHVRCEHRVDDRSQRFELFHRSVLRFIDGEIAKVHQ